LHHVCRVVGPPTTPSSRSVQCGQRPPRNGWQLRQGSGRGLPTRRRESGPRTPATLPGWQCRLTPGWDQLAPRTVNMASPVTADFFENGTNKQFEWVLGKYQEALQAKAEGKPGKAESLLKLDKWYQNDLPKKIKGRGKEGHLTHEELVQTIKWKLARGKFYPQLTNLVRINTPRAVQTESKKAFRKLPNLDAAITTLCGLKGVGCTLASAVLAAGCPELAPFMADECLLSMGDTEGIDYTMKEYMKLVAKTQACVDRLNEEGGSWTPHKVELAVWTHYVARDNKPEILADMPSRHAPKVDRFPSTVETPATNGEVRDEDNVEAEPVKNGGTEENPETEEAPQIAPVSFEDAVPAAPEPEVTPEVTPDQPAVNGHSQVDPDQALEQYQSTEVPAEAPESSPQVPAAVENAPLISEASEVTPPAELPLEHSANGISNGAGGNGWENHEPHNGAGSHHESEPVPTPEPAAEAPAPLKRPLEQEAEEEVEEQQEAKRVRESEVQGGDHEQDQVHHGEQQQQPVVPSPQLPIHTGGD